VKPSLLLWILLSASLPCSAAAAPALVDSGTFRIWRNQTSLGTERFAYSRMGDSLVVTSWLVEMLRSAQGVDTLEKQMTLVLKADDFDLRSYESRQHFMGQKLLRGLVMEDTSFTAFTQVNLHGSGEKVVRPPGRMLVIDPQVFTLYDVICRDLHGRTFDRRALLLYALGSPDTTMEATAIDLGQETIRWGSRSVAARKIHVQDGGGEYFMWISSKGQMLRLSQPAYGMQIERVSPRATSAPKKPRSSG
jgi:hypothetical protein